MTIVWSETFLISVHPSPRRGRVGRRHFKGSAPPRRAQGLPQHRARSQALEREEKVGVWGFEAEGLSYLLAMVS